MAKELTAKKGLNIPVVFAAVANPVDIKLIDSINNSGNNLVGSVEVTDYERQLNVLKYFKPSVKNLLLVYNPAQGSGLETDKQKVPELAIAHGLNLVAVPVYSAQEVYPKAAAYCDTADAIMVLKDNTVVTAIESLVKLGNNHSIPLMTSELKSVSKGATFGLGIHEYDYGVTSAHLAARILNEGLKPTELPSRPVNSF